MAKIGEQFVTTLKKAHLEWGVYRHTSSRGVVYGEGYLQIPKKEAKRLEIYNSNKFGATIEYYCDSVDGFLNNVILKAAGSSTAGEVYAKQFQGCGDLQIIGNWFKHVNATIGDEVKITWVEKYRILIEKI